MADFVDKLAEFVCWTITLYKRKTQNVGEFTYSESHRRGISKSLCLLQAVNLSGDGLASLVLNSSPVVLILSVLWCEVQADEILRDGVYPSLPLPSTMPMSIHLSFYRIRLMQWSSSRRWTCPYHLSLDSRIFWLMQETPTAWRMSSFLFLAEVTCDTNHPSEHSHLNSFKKPLFISSQDHASAP